MNPMDRVDVFTPSAHLKLMRGFALTAFALGLAGCVAGGSSGGGSSGASTAQCPATGNDGGCNGNCADVDPTAFLTEAEVQNIINQALNEATARGATTNTTVAVVDRVGNVLGVARIGSGANVTVTALPLVRTGGLEGASVPAAAAAIAKAITGAYLSSEGNAFSSRTANFIVQEHYPPGVDNGPGGPLYGVQFSQLPCSDLAQRGTTLGVGPHRSPLGLAADPGGFPLFKNGTPVGGIGVISDGIYGIDVDVTDNDRTQGNAALNNFNNNDEVIALAGSFGFEAPDSRQANRITADGIQLAYSDAVAGDRALATPSTAAVGGTTTVDVANFITHDGGAGGTPYRDGTRFTTAASGIVAADDNLVAGGTGARTLDAFVLTEADGTTPRDLDQATGGAQNSPRAGTQLSQAEVTQLLKNALGVANRAFAQIRRPTCSQARVTISVVDTNGDILGIVRTRDAPVFGTDVSLQKARSALFFSSADAAASLGAAGLATDYVNAYRNITSGGTLADGIAFGNRSIGNLARPFFPDGIDANFRGPFSVEFNANWSPFNVGLQSDVVVAANGLTDATRCTVAGIGGRLGNGLQIFAGGVPIFKAGALAGGIGISGDGIEQDDMIAFLGLHEAGVALSGSIGNAPTSQRIDTRDHIVKNAAGGNIGTTRVRYVQCPFQPFIGSTEQNPCNGK